MVRGLAVGGACAVSRGSGTLAAGIMPSVAPLGVGVLLIAVGFLLQEPHLLSGEPLAHLLIAGTAAVLLLHRLFEPAAAPVAPDFRVGTMLAVAAAVAAAAAPVAPALRLMCVHLSLALMLLSVIAAAFGARMAGRLAVPLLMLYVLVPMLPLFEATLSYPMRRLSALLAQALLSLGPGEAQVDGTELVWGDLRVSVTSACSGMTLLQNLLWMAWWTVLLRHRGFWTRLAHGLLAAPAVVIANTLRVVALAVAASWYGEQILVGTPHVIIGWMAVVVAAGLFLVMEELFPATAHRGSG